MIDAQLWLALWCAYQVLLPSMVIAALWRAHLFGHLALTKTRELAACNSAAAEARLLHNERITQFDALARELQTLQQLLSLSRTEISTLRAALEREQLLNRNLNEQLQAGELSGHREDSTGELANGSN